MYNPYTTMVVLPQSSGCMALYYQLQLGMIRMIIPAESQAMMVVDEAIRVLRFTHTIFTRPGLHGFFLRRQRSFGC